MITVLEEGPNRSAALSGPTVTARVLSRVGTTVHRKYRIDRLLGVGGMGAVYAGTHRNGHRVAIKFLLERFVDMPDVHRRFSREAYVANQVQHPGAVPVLDDDVDDAGCPFLIMPLLEGETLHVRAQRAKGRLPLAEAGVWIAEALAVLGSAHARGIVHRDIKPENLFITRAGEVRVLDFGVAQRLDGDPSITITGQIVGTPAFMPPEQARGDRAAIGPHSDCWAMGAVLFTLLSGEHVHQADGAGPQLIAAATRNARSLAEVVPDAPPSVVRCVDKALAFDAADRWRSAGELRSALVEALEEATGEPFAAIASSLREGLDAQVSGVRIGPPATVAAQETELAHLRPWPASTEIPPKGSERRILHCGNGVAVGQYGPLCFVIWRDRVTFSKFERQRQGLAEVVRSRPDGVAFLCIIEPGTKPPDDVLRRASSEMITGHLGRLKCAAPVIEGTGFWAAMTRSVLVGMELVVFRKMPASAFSDVAGALQWMRRYIPIDPAMAAAFIEEVRSQLDRA